MIKELLCYVCLALFSVEISGTQRFNLILDNGQTGYISLCFECCAFLDLQFDCNFVFSYL